MINLKKSAEKIDVIFTVALILLGIVAYFIFTPKTYKYGEVVFNNELTYLKKDMSLITGNIKDSIYIGEFVNGKKEGLHSLWYENGQLKEDGSYSNGKKVGLHQFWKKNGQPEKEENYVNGEIKILKNN